MRGVGVEWVRTLTRTYDVAKMRDTLREALTTEVKGPKVIIASSECMLNKQRREKPLAAQARQARRTGGARPLRRRSRHLHRRSFLHPAVGLSVAHDRAQSRSAAARAVTKVINTCVGCGNCGEVAHAAVLCPSFYRASIIDNPTGWDRFKDKRARRGDRLLQRRLDERMAVA